MSHRVTKVSHESVPQERSTRVSPTRVSKNVWAFVFEYVFAFGFVDSICFFFLRFLVHPDLVNVSHPVNVNALATVAALAEQMGCRREAEELLQEAEELHQEMEGRRGRE